MKIKYRDMRSYKYQLLETVSLKTRIKPMGPNIHTEFIDLLTDGYLNVLKGYAWDGPSGPAIDTPSFMRGSLVHDAFYQLIRMGLLPIDRRDEVDRLLRQLCLEDGMNPIRAIWVFTAVRGFGGLACAPRPIEWDAVKEAP